MHWVIQDGFFNETGMNDLVELLTKYEIPHTIVKVIPFIGEIVPDINPTGNVICFGSYSMRHTAKSKGWYPGVFDLEGICETMYDPLHPWYIHLLNMDFIVSTFGNVIPTVESSFGDIEEFFMRPVSDSKVFAGDVFSKEDVKEWVYKVGVLNEDDGTSLTIHTPVLVSHPLNIQAEYRLFVIKGKIITASQYKINRYVKYDKLVDDDILQFGQDRVNELHFADAYCLDLCRTSNGIKIVEVNTINSAGFYHADVNKLIEVFEVEYAEHD